MSGHQRVRLHVEHKMTRGSFDPTLGGLRRLDCVETRVCLDDGEPRRIVAKPRLGARRSVGIEDAVGRERSICPSGGSNANLGAISTKGFSGLVVVGDASGGGSNA